MPYKSESIIISGTKFDRRIKLTDAQREEIIKLHFSGWTQRKIAKKFGVDKSTIRFVVNPEAYQAYLQYRKDVKAHKKYYDREKNTKAVRESRNYKQQLKMENKIKVEEDTDGNRI